jgi:uncharacterized membrane protein
VNRVGLNAPFRWLGQGFSDFRKALAPALLYGVVVAGVSAWISYALVASNLAFWVLTLSCGFVFIAPMLAMGLYEAGRLIEAGGAPTLQRVLFVRRAVRSDVAYLGLALLMIYFLWGRFAQLVYGLSTYTLHTSVDEFVNFALTTGEGHTMLITGTIVGAVFAFATFALVVVSAPMLLDRRANVFVATITSVSAVAKNFAPLLLWALIITALLIASAATWFTALVVVFPWLGLASWRAYRELVEMPA